MTSSPGKSLPFTEPGELAKNIAWELWITMIEVGYGGDGLSRPEIESVVQRQLNAWDESSRKRPPTRYGIKDGLLFVDLDPGIEVTEKELPVPGFWSRLFRRIF